jgi:hypothetical protein
MGQRLLSLQQCATCANIKDPAARAACLRCVAPAKGKPAAECSSCLDADNKDPNKPNMAGIEACFSCVAKAPASAAAQCPLCYRNWNVGPSKMAACSTCVQKAASPVAAAACAPCHNSLVADTKGCLECATKAKTAGDAVGCGECANTNNVLPGYTAMCRECVFKAREPAKSYCYNTMTRVPVSPAATAVTKGYYQCLAGAKDQDSGQGCMFCYRGAVESPGDDGPSCYACVNALPISFNANSCSSCWSAARKAKGKQCQACVASKPKGTYAFDCYGGR